MEWKRLSQRETPHRIAANHNALVIFLQAINDRLLRETRRRLSRRWQACNMYWMRLRRSVTLVPLSRPGALCGRRWQAIKRRFQSFSRKGLSRRPRSAGSGRGGAHAYRGPTANGAPDRRFTLVAACINFSVAASPCGATCRHAKNASVVSLHRAISA